MLTGVFLIASDVSSSIKLVWDMNLYQSSGHARAVGQEVVIIAVAVHKLVSACDNIYLKKKLI